MSLRPRTYVGLGFGRTALDRVPVWADMSTRLYSAHTERGRESQLDEYLPGSLTLALKNNDGLLMPSNPASPYFSSGTPASTGDPGGDPPPVLIDSSGNGRDGTFYQPANLVFEEPGCVVGNDAITIVDGAAFIGYGGTPPSTMLAGSAWMCGWADPQWNTYGAQLWNISGFGTAFTLFLQNLGGGNHCIGCQRAADNIGAIVDTRFSSSIADAAGAHFYFLTYNAATDTYSFYEDGTFISSTTGSGHTASTAIPTQAVIGANDPGGDMKYDELAYGHGSVPSAGTIAALYAAATTSFAAYEAAMLALSPDAYYHLDEPLTSFVPPSPAVPPSNQVVPGVQVLVADGFVGRTHMATPSVYWPFDESTAPAWDSIRSARLEPPAASNYPTFGVDGILGRGVEFDGIDQLLTAGNAAIGASGSTGRSLIGVVRVDSTGMIVQFNRPTTGASQRALALDYTTAGKLRLRIRSTSAEKTVEVAASTGWHLVVGGYKSGSKPVLRVDGAVTSSTGVLSGLTVPLIEAEVGRGFAGMVDEIAMTDHWLNNGQADEFLDEYGSRWRPGVVHFRGHVQPDNPYEFTFPNKRDAMMTIKALDWMARISNVTVPPTGPSSSTAPPIRVGANEDSGARVLRLLNASKIPEGMRRLDDGYSLMLGTSLGVNALGEVQQVARSENGAFYSIRSGQLRYDNRYRPFQEIRQMVAQSTYSDEAGSTLGYRGPQFGYAQLIRNNVVMGNSTFSTSLESTASQDAYGISTTERTDMRNAFAEDMIEQGRFVLAAYSSGRFTPTEISVTPLESSDAYRAMCFRELRDRIRVKQLAPGTTGRQATDSTIEKDTRTIGRGQMLVTYGLDSADRFNFIRSTELLILDSTEASQRLTAGRLGY